MPGAARIGLLGGTFDPVHNAHLAMARAALEALALDEVRFMPTGNPKYRKPALATPAQRIAMLRAATASEPRFRIDERELAADASGYTVDTLRALREELGPQAELWFLMGADQYASLPTWHRPDEVRRLAKLGVFERPGVQFSDQGARVIRMAPLPISASELRRRAARGEDLSDSVPAAVANYIRTHSLYS